MQGSNIKQQQSSSQSTYYSGEKCIEDISHSVKLEELEVKMLKIIIPFRVIETATTRSYYGGLLELCLMVRRFHVSDRIRFGFGSFSEPREESRTINTLEHSWKS